MPQPPRFHPARPKLWRPVRRDSSGLTGPTKAQAAGPYWRQTGHGWYLPADLELHQPDQRIVEAGVLLPSYGGVTGWAALHWLGAEWFGGLQDDGVSLRDVDLAVRHGDIRNQPGMKVTSERLTGSEFVVVDGLSVSIAARSVLFEMRYARDERAAAMTLAMAAASDLVSVDEARAFATPGLNGWTGVPQARAGIELAVENSWSPQEFLMCLQWELDAGFPRPLCNQPIFDHAGRHLGTPDLLDLESGTLGEYDGALHLEGRRRSRDLEREDGFRRVGLECFTVVAADRADPERVVRRMQEARARARWEAEAARQWTVVPPAWWVPTATVAQRRALSDAQRARFLRRRVS